MKQKFSLKINSTRLLSLICLGLLVISSNFVNAQNTSYADNFEDAYATSGLSELVINATLIRDAHKPLKFTTFEQLETYFDNHPAEFKKLITKGLFRLPIHTDNQDQQLIEQELRDRLDKLRAKHGIKHKLKIEILHFNVGLERQKEIANEIIVNAFDYSQEHKNDLGALIRYLEEQRDIRRTSNQEETRELIQQSIDILNELDALPKSENGEPDYNAFSELLSRYGIVLSEKEVAANSQEASILKKLGYPVPAYAKGFRMPFVDLKSSEMLQGGLAKAFPFWCAISLWSSTYPNTPWAFWAATSLSLVLDIFHGPMASSWINLQDRMSKEMGENYQKNFNFLYGLLTGFGFRLISLVAPEGVIENWFGTTNGIFNLVWLGVIIPGEKVSANFGTRAYNGLIRLNGIGRLSVRSRDGIQQWVRDLGFMLSGLYVGAGGEADPRFWALYAFRQLVDESIHLFSKMFSHRDMLYVGTNEAMSSNSFALMYPYAVSSEPPPAATPLRKLAVEGLYHTTVQPVTTLTGMVGINYAVKNAVNYCKSFFVSEGNDLETAVFEETIDFSNDDTTLLPHIPEVTDHYDPKAHDDVGFTGHHHNKGVPLDANIQLD